MQENAHHSCVVVFTLQKKSLSYKLKICTQLHLFSQSEHIYVNSTLNQKAEYITSPLQSPTLGPFIYFFFVFIFYFYFFSGPFKLKPEIDLL